ncbi:hypothetical protein M8J76_004536 [Diaphorina citri]|nr:hypothetical protein M8J76_004536 [Diaphorina citri]
MAGVHNSRSRLFDKELGGYQPYQHVQSMGDDFIEDLAYKQNVKHYSLQKLLNEEKEFQSSHTFKPITEYNEGTTSLQSFISHIDSNEPQASTSNESPERYLGLSRHEYDILKSVKPNSETTRLLTFALASKKAKGEHSSFVPKDHPINHLQELHDHTFTDADPQKTAKTIIRKRKQLLQYYSEPIGPEPKASKPNSLWDVKDPTSLSLQSKREYTVANSTKVCNPASTTMSPNSKAPTKLPTNSNPISRSQNGVNKPQTLPPKQVESGGQPFVAPVDCQLSEAKLRLIPRFSEDEIRMIPRFQNWSRGEPSKTLYIKNLAPSVTDLNLASIFQQFQDPRQPRISFRTVLVPSSDHAHILTMKIKNVNDDCLTTADIEVFKPRKDKERLSDSDSDEAEAQTRRPGNSKSPSASPSAITLLSYHEAPTHLQFNPYILSGYRGYFIFWMTNETINIWSHIFGWMLFLALTLYDLFLLNFEASVFDKFIVGLLLGCFQICMVTSTLYHVFSCKSERHFHNFLTFDLFGIALSLLAIYLTGVYYAFWCHKEWQNFYLATVFAIFIACMILQIPRLNIHPDIKMLVFVCWAAYGVVPTVHWAVIMGGWDNPIVNMLLPRVMGMYGISGLAFLIYITRFPECFFTGKVDYIGSSHQWWHFFVVLALYYWHNTGIKYIEYRMNHGCTHDMRI